MGPNIFGFRISICDFSFHQALEIMIVHTNYLKCDFIQFLVLVYLVFLIDVLGRLFSIPMILIVQLRSDNNPNALK